MPANPQQRLEGKYEILRKIREGGMGAIYKVRHRLLDEVRVIKVMRPQLGGDAEFKARFIREAQTAIKLRHPNIAHLYDFTLGDDDTAFIVMEFIDGKTLEDLLKSNGPPALGLTLEIAQQSLRALGYLHGKGFVHRDISPDNLMLCEDADGNPQVKLIDLGIAKVPEGSDSHLTRTGTFLGKLRYASPEQFGSAGTPGAEARGDLYSFGLVLYELLTGTYPISGSDASSLIAGHLFRPPRPFEESDPAGRVPAGLREVILRTLAKHPEERPATARDLAQELAAFRVPGDLHPSDWHDLLAIDLDETASLLLAPPSSTQHSLDQHFGPSTTPVPSPGFAQRLRDAAQTNVGPSPSGSAPMEPLLAGINELLESGSFREAAQLLRRAERLTPTHPDLMLMRSRVANVARHRRDVRRQRAQISRRAGEIEKALQRGDLEAGATMLAAAVSELGESDAWQGPRERLDRMRREVQKSQLGALLMRARQLAAKGDLTLARERLHEARQISPDHPGVDNLAEEIDADIARLERERRRAEKLAQAVEKVRDSLSRDELTEASRLLDLAVVRFGASPALHEQWENLEQKRREALRQQIEGLRNQARWSAANGDSDTARRALGQARELAARVPALQAVVAAATSELGLAASGEERFADLLVEARLLLNVHDFAGAVHKLTAALEERPGDAEASALLAQARQHSS